MNSGTKAFDLFTLSFVECFSKRPGCQLPQWGWFASADLGDGLGFYTDCPTENFACAGEVVEAD